MRVELFYFDGCPSHQRLIQRLPTLLEHAGINLRRRCTRSSTVTTLNANTSSAHHRYASTVATSSPAPEIATTTDSSVASTKPPTDCQDFHLMNGFSLP